jgi:hypothetical protein
MTSLPKATTMEKERTKMRKRRRQHRANDSILKNKTDENYSL